MFLALLTLSLLSETDTMAKNAKKTTKKAGGPPPNETPEQAFRRLANKRTNKAVATMNLICGLTGSAYASTETQQNAIVVALQAAVDSVKDAFAGKGKAAGGFDLPE